MLTLPQRSLLPCPPEQVPEYHPLSVCNPAMRLTDATLATFPEALALLQKLVLTCPSLINFPAS